MAKANVLEIRPQKGFQERALSTPADIAIIGGSAGGGKTWSLIIEALKHIQDPKFGAVYFRRTKETIRATGGLWDESKNWCPKFGGNPLESILKWKFPSGATIDFEGIEYEKDLTNWMGTQIPLIIFDELTEFTKKMFFFMISRNRGICSIRPYIRCSCNPDPDSWVAEFLSWWIDQDTGYPIPERDGVLRYMMNYKDNIVWGDTPQEVIDKCPEAFTGEKFLASGIDKESLIKSVTFIAGDVYENKILLQNDPGYLGSLNSMDEADQARFLGGNWKVRSDGMGLYDHSALEGLFSNYISDDSQLKLSYNPRTGEPMFSVTVDNNKNFITCDAAKFGRDLCVIMVWRGSVVIHTTVFYLSSPQDIKNEIELLRMTFGVPRVNVCVDQDGIGGDVVKLGGYYGFMARRESAISEDTGEKENYKSRKDQCYYKSAERVNRGDVKMIITKETVKIFDKGAKNARWSTMLKWKGEMVDIRTLIKNHLRAIKRGKTDFEGGMIKYCTNTKEEQKEILSGDSPDFADTLMMVEDFQLSRRRKGKFGSN